MKEILKRRKGSKQNEDSLNLMDFLNWRNRQTNRTKKCAHTDVFYPNDNSTKIRDDA
jgi:hypothetical protein